MMTKTTGIAVIIPSYNESKNLSILIPRIFRVLPKALVVIVDDSRGEEQKQTERVCRNIGKQITYISRNGKLGRGSAVIDGIKQALLLKSTVVCIEMDADLAHDPDEFPKLLSRIGSFDMVIGSRYMDGSKIVKWPLSRLVQSRIINFVLRYWLGLRISDYTNGFRAYTRKSCEYLTSIEIREKGFVSLSEVAYKLQKKGFRITEVPITFTDREFGKSNANFTELMHSLAGVIHIKMDDW